MARPTVLLGTQENILMSLKIQTQNMEFLGLETMFSFLIQLGLYSSLYPDGYKPNF